jgi:hypothetical protein
MIKSKLTRALLPGLVLLQAALLASCCCHVCPPAEDAADHEPQIKQAIAIINTGGAWSPTRAQQLKDITSTLPGPQRYEVLRRFASALNTRKITVPPGVDLLTTGGRPGSACPGVCQPFNDGNKDQRGTEAVPPAK